MTAATFHGMFRVTQADARGASGMAMRLQAAAFPGASVGQFIMMRTSGMLWRPMSVADVDHDTGNIEVAFQIVGPGTEWLATRVVGDAIECTGPFGKGFPAPDPRARWAVIGSGVELAMMVGLMHQFRALSPWLTGYVVGEEPPWSDLALQAFKEAGIPCHLITLQDFREGKVDVPPTVMAAGSRPMLAEIAESCRALQATCYVALEERMACAVGACWACVVPSRDHSERPYFRVCREGPVFDAAHVAL